MLEHLTGSPLAFATGCLVWLPVAIWVLSLVHWLILAEIDILTFFLGLSTAIGLGVMAMNPPDPIIAPLTFVFMVLTVVLYPVVRGAVQRRELRSLDYDSIGRAYELLAENPTNVAARVRLARALYATGRPGHALRIAEEAIARMPHSLFPDEHRMVAQWTLLVQSPDAFAPASCGHCGHPNEAGQVYCSRCGREVFLGPALPIGGMIAARRWIAAWFAALAALIGVPSAAKGLPPGAALGAIVGLILIAFFALIWAFRRESATA